jgi:uncharacterized membrane protein YkgB
MSQKNIFTFSRIALFIIYFWFGLLKVLGLSPATPMVHGLFEKMSMGILIPFDLFIILFGAFEMLIGILFLIGKFRRITLILFVLHMITTIFPLFIMGGMVWDSFGTPTLEGQYIVKNLALIAIVLHLYKRKDE